VTDPFTVLGLPARPDLTDADVHAAWRRIAAATHPDRADGGDPDRYAVASMAYTDLRTPGRRGEARADLAAGKHWGPAAPVERAAAGHRAPPGRSTGRLAARIWRGRPALLALRVAITAGLCVAAFGIAGVQPAAAGVAAGALTWLLLTARHDLAPPGTP
jgi:hypothetical protein